MLALGQSVVEIMRGSILGRHIGPLLIARQLTDGFHAGSTMVHNLHEVEVASGLDGDADLDAGADLTLTIDHGPWTIILL